MNDIGHNNPPSKFELFKIDIAALAADVEDLENVEITNETSGQFNDIIGRGKDLSKDIDATRKIEKEPHWEAGKAVDAAFNPLKDMALNQIKPLQARLQAWLTEQKRIAEEARKAAEEKARAEAEAAKVLADDAILGDQIAQDAEAAAAEARLAAAEEKARSTVKGSDGYRASGIRTTYRAKVIDAVLLVEAFSDHPDVIAAAEKAANAAIRSATDKKNLTIPGVEIVAQEKLV